MALYTTTALIAALQRNTMLPTNKQTFQNSDFITMMNEELQTVIVPRIRSAREDYFLTSIDYPIVPGQSMYQIPSTAIGMDLKEVQKIDESGNPYKLPRLDISQIASVRSGYQEGFYLQGNQVVLWPVPTANSPAPTLRLYYFDRPNDLCDDVSQSAPVTGVNTSTNTITFAVAPSVITQGSLVCVVQGTPGFDTRMSAVPVINVSANTITLGTSVLDALGNPMVSVGDYVALDGTSPIPQVMVEAHPLLTQSTIVKTLLSIGDDRWKAAQEKYAMMDKKLIEMITPRVEDSPKNVTTGGRGIMDVVIWNQPRGYRR